MNFGSMVFGDEVMRERLPVDAYNTLKRTISGGLALDLSLANTVAEAMKNWAIEKGATHYSHWFIPMTGSTAEKHDAFLSFGAGGEIIYKLSGRNLIKGESDASSFPSGGLRATFEARGYTAWDCTSPAFIKGKSLCIPTAFCSYNGDALDEKIPLLRAMETLDRAAVRLYNLIGLNVNRVYTYVGAEQEYFLVDKSVYSKRPDLIFTGRTLLGRRPPKGQELNDHYFGNIKPRVRAFMADLDAELWKLGVPAKTEHNETAPSQHELAPLYTVANIAADTNHLTMEVMKNVANRHNLVCLLHEKPFLGLSGSGKHNNWSLGTDSGLNLLEPGSKPDENLPFLLTLAAVIRGVDKYGELIRMAVSGAGNDCRLGAHEAPPPVVSLYLGGDITQLLTELETGAAVSSAGKRSLKKTVTTLPELAMDNSDRNRTSPIAFTGNKFEIRMTGASGSIAPSNVMFNAIVADAMTVFADKLEGASDVRAAAYALIKRIISKHKRIIFNGDSYAAEWADEARRRGLPCHNDTVDALETLKNPDNIALLTRTGVLTESELSPRYSIMLEKYAKTINIEARSLVEIIRTMVIPAVARQTHEYARVLKRVNETVASASIGYLTDLVLRTTELADGLSADMTALENQLDSVAEVTGARQKALFYRDTVLPIINCARQKADALEGLVDKDIWPLPDYGALLFYD